MESLSAIAEVIDKIGRGFEQFKEVNDKRLDEERKSNEGRAAELSAMLEKISADLTNNVKAKAEIEKKQALLQDRLELMEAMNKRPGVSIEDKIKSEHRDLFIKWVRSRGEDLSVKAAYAELQSKAANVKNVTIGSGAGGGFAVPEEILRTVDSMLLRISPVLQFFKNVQVGTSDYKELLTVNVATYAWATETGTRNASDPPLLRERAPTWGELYAYATASNWSLQDIFFDVGTWIAEAVAEAWAVGLATAAWSGNASGKVTGIINTTPTSSADTASPMRSQEALQYVPLTAAHGSPFAASGFNADDLIALVYTLNPRYRGNARFAMNTATQGYARRLKDSYGQYLWQPSLQLGQPDMVLGFPVTTWEDMGTATTANAYPVGFGDLNQAYILATRAGTEIIRDNVTAAGFTKFYIARRYGGIIKNNDAFKLLKVALS